MIGAIFLPVLLFGLFLASAENAAPGVTTATVTVAAEIYTLPQLPAQLASATAKGGHTQ